MDRIITSLGTVIDDEEASRTEVDSGADHLVAPEDLNVSWRQVAEDGIKESHGPSAILIGRHRDETLFYGRGGPSRLLKVVVDLSGDRGAIVADFARKRVP